MVLVTAFRLTVGMLSDYDESVIDPIGGRSSRFGFIHCKDGRIRSRIKPKNSRTKEMKTKSITAILSALLVTGGFSFAQNGDIGRCGQPRGTCGNQCDGCGYLNQGRGQGNGNGQGLRKGKRDGSGNGGGEQKRDRKRDGTGAGCKQGT